MKENQGLFIASRLPRSMLFLLCAFLVTPGFGQGQGFDVMEATIEGIHDAYHSGRLTSRQLTQLYLDRIEAYDKKGPQINSIITINPKADRAPSNIDNVFAVLRDFPRNLSGAFAQSEAVHRSSATPACPPET